MKPSLKISFEKYQIWRCREPGFKVVLHTIHPGKRATGALFEAADELFARPLGQRGYKEGLRRDGGYSLYTTVSVQDIMECVGTYEYRTADIPALEVGQLWQCRNQQYLWVAGDTDREGRFNGSIFYSGIDRSGVEEDELENYWTKPIRTAALQYGWPQSTATFHTHQARAGVYESYPFTAGDYDLCNLLRTYSVE